MSEVEPSRSSASQLPDAVAQASALPAGSDAKPSLWRWLRSAMGVGIAPIGRRDTVDDDVSERNRLEVENAALRARIADQDESLASRARAVALASHELRTPLNGILGMADLLDHTALTPEQASYVNTIANSATALINLVDDLLDAGKMAAGHWRLRPRRVDLVAWIEEIAELLAPRAQSKGLELAAYVAADVPLWVEADPEQLTRIIMNLAGNAIKFTERGGVTIEITAAPAATTTRLRIIVRDSGVGIAAADQARIFAEYEQADGIPVAATPGTGLGLSIARAIARAMRADLTVESTLGEGAQFTLSLEVPVLDRGAERARPFAGRRFLLVSDSMIELSVLMRRLFDLGAVVDCASSPAAAREAIDSAEHFDAVLLDDSRAIDSDGLVALCQKNGRPAVALTTPAGRGRLDHLRGLGLAAHLIKPIRTQTLRRILAKVIDGGIEVPASRPEVIAQINGKASRGLRVLLADDNEINTLLAISMIGRQGHHIEAVEDGAAAIEAAKAAISAGRAFDVVLMDLHMPVVDGFVAIEAIRAEEIRAERPSTIIALTADATAVTAERAIAAGADIALTKPVQAARMAEILGNVEAELASIDARASA